MAFGLWEEIGRWARRLSKVAITDAAYGHLPPGATRQAANALEQILTDGGHNATQPPRN